MRDQEHAPKSPFHLLIDFFQRKGLEALKREDRDEEWFQDWIDYQAEHKLYASVLSPSRYSTVGRSLNLLKLVNFIETFAFLSPAHAYSLHVTFLGLAPILMSTNEPLKRKAVAALEKGNIFAFGVSEQAHGADLLANECIVTAGPDNGRIANGSKYYIGNANCASFISVLAKQIDSRTADRTRRAPFILFALRPRESQGFKNLRKIHTFGVRAAFVGQFDIQEHPLPDCDVIARGRDAWNAVVNTVTIGKFFLGFGAIGICAHAYAEAIDHLRRRILYGRPVIELPHIHAMMVEAFARLTAMRLFAYRALDYLQAASDSERRYLLFNAVQKAKVSTEGVKVMNLISECVGARGFESETYIETALREVPMIPSLEGSTHINLRLTCQFIENYFTSSSDVTSSPPSVLLKEIEPVENPYWFAGAERNPKTVPFSDHRLAFEPIRAIASVRTLLKQIDAFRRFIETGILKGKASSADTATLIAVGRCFSHIVFAQLVAEMAHKAHLSFSIVSVIVAGIVEDLSAEALKLAAFFGARSDPACLVRKIVRIPRTRPADLRSVAEIIADRYRR